MTTAQAAYARLRELLAEVRDLEMARELLYWDQQTQMPPGGAIARAEQMTTLRRIIHAKFTAPEIGDLLDQLAEYAASLPYDSDEASMIRVTRREYQREVRVPASLVAAMSNSASESYGIWLAARAAKDFRAFLPALERTVALSREYAAALGFADNPLDGLIDLREPGLTSAQLESLFAELRATLVPLARQIFAQGGARERVALLRQRYEPSRQLELGLAAVRAIGFNLDQRGRQALSVHPFSINFTADDTRITTRVKEDNLGPSFFALLHEAGHGTYMQGIPARLRRSILAEGASAGLHESQSRLWENVVGRSRYFWQFFLPVAKAMFPAQFAGADVEDIYRAANVVEPSLIRVEADEVTYNLHIMLRFELEKAVLSGQLALPDLRDAWNAKFDEYLGITPPDDLLGVLQDIHWTGNFGGSFQGYTIGNVTGTALYLKALADHPNMHSEWSRGNFSTLLHWMQDNVHTHGAKFMPEELLIKATGQGLTAAPYLQHIKAKYSELYDL